MKKAFFTALFVTLLSSISYAQIDTVFWFAAPEVSDGHADEPVSLNISTFGQPANVTISIPTNPAFTPINITVPANSFHREVLDYYDEFEQAANDCQFSTDGCNAAVQNLPLLENDVQNSPQNKGLLITSDEDITVYYEVLGLRCNPSYAPGVCFVINTDIFSLKGRNALGTDFYIPMQNEHRNVTTDNWATPINGRSSIDFVATEDNTTITVELSNPADGIVGSTHTFTLNAGQTYSIRASGLTGATNLGGSHITSDKPIAITVKDDSIERVDASQNGYVYDLAGDQIIPTALGGLEYIVKEGYAYIIATQNNTQIFQDGNATPITTMSQAGDIFSIDLTANPNPTYITSDKPVLMYHLSEIYGELNKPEFGGAVIPQINCTGSPTVSFNRSSNEPNEEFYLTILVKAGNEDQFQLNGGAVNTDIAAADFVTVPGTGGAWMYYNELMSTAQVVPLATSTVSTANSEVFHLGLVNGRPFIDANNPSTGARYGYFSNFEQLIVNIDVSDQCITPGDSIQVGVLPGFASVDWSTGSTADSIWINTSGQYWVVVENALGCTDSVNFNVIVNTIPQFIVNPDELLCPGTTFNAGVDSGTVGSSATYEWTLDGNPYSTDSALVTTTPGVYVLTVTNGCGMGSDTVVLTNWDVEVPNIFTPNGDGVNETFMVPGLLAQGTWQLTVVNRWGEKVYFNEAYDNSWNGVNQKTNEVAEGTYFFYLIDKDSEECNEYKGWVQVMR